MQSLYEASILGFDGSAGVLGLFLAVALTTDGFAPGFGAQTAVVLVAVRLTFVLASGLHRWPFQAARALDGARLFGAMLAATIAFALVARGLPPSTYALEFFFTTSAMAALRYAPALAGDIYRTRLPAAKAQFMTAEFPRRVLNVLVALLGIVLSAPLWLAIAAAIKLTSRGPVFYTQERVGLDLRAGRGRGDDPRRKQDLGGRPFRMIKFRTMRVDAEAGTGAVWCGKEDPRVTPVGRFLRHCRLDELPQLLNVLKGDMNVVGPRPERAPIFADLREKLPNYVLRQRVRPGITGFAQVNLEYDATLEDVAHKLEYDLEYLSRQGVGMDLYIMAKTPLVMLLRDRMIGRTGAARGEVSSQPPSPVTVPTRR
jgi:lipopolysaccharide/colanic/teichoic acid biosynthesis glycosyltransferase